MWGKKAVKDMRLSSQSGEQYEGGGRQVCVERSGVGWSGKVLVSDDLG